MTHVVEKKYVNLLPPLQQKALRLKAVKAELWVFGYRLLASIIVMAVVLLGAGVFLQSQLNEKTASIAVRSAELASFEQSGLREEVAAINLNLDNFQTLRNNDEHWSEIFIEFAKLLPPEVTVSSFTVARDTKKIEAQGRAASREAVLQLRQNLLDSEYFETVNFPLSNLERARDVNWRYRFYINPEKQKP